MRSPPRRPSRSPRHQWRLCAPVTGEFGRCEVASSRYWRMSTVAGCPSTVPLRVARAPPRLGVRELHVAATPAPSAPPSRRRLSRRTRASPRDPVCFGGRGEVPRTPPPRATPQDSSGKAGEGCKVQGLGGPWTTRWSLWSEPAQNAAFARCTKRRFCARAFVAFARGLLSLLRAFCARHHCPLSGVPAPSFPPSILAPSPLLGLYLHRKALRQRTPRPHRPFRHPTRLSAPALLTSSHRARRCCRSAYSRNRATRSAT